MPMRLADIARTFARVLTFQARPDELASLDRPHLYAGFICTWIVGMGRWWDDPEASLLQHLGLGSVVYVFVLSFVLWLIVLPLKPQRWTYRLVLTFVMVTSAPALLYAIPVERFVSMSTAGTLNVLFLLTVAVWRVGLLLRFLTTVPQIGVFKGIVTSLLPLSGIVFTLFVLNLHRAVFEVMSSIASDQPTAHDASYAVLFALTMLSAIVLPVLLVLYAGAIVHVNRKRLNRGPRR